jgi:hypothetical protein
MGYKLNSPHGLTANIVAYDDKQLKFISTNGIGCKNLRAKL